MRWVLYDHARRLDCMQRLSAGEQSKVLRRVHERHGKSVEMGCIGIGVALGSAMTLTVIALACAFPERGGVVPLGAAVSLGVVSFLLVRARDASLRKLVVSQVGRTTCPTCHRTLIGSPRSASAVRCAECAAIRTFHELEIVPADIGDPVVSLTKDTRCPRCGYSWAGAGTDRRIVTCAECGYRLQVLVEDEFE